MCQGTAVVGKCENLFLEKKVSTSMHKSNHHNDDNYLKSTDIITKNRVKTDELCI
jgi:hypothetical protein